MCHIPNVVNLVDEHYAMLFVQGEEQATQGDIIDFLQQISNEC